jgi:hypothetical protein
VTAAVLERPVPFCSFSSSHITISIQIDLAALLYKALSDAAKQKPRETVEL